MKNVIDGKNNKNERGAALVTVLMISVLLGIACIALLSSVGANSRNSTDVLSETKAYYAAESGLQATINLLRNNAAVTYPAAIADPDLSSWLNYNCTNNADGSATVSVGPNACSLSSGTSYKVVVTDPDNTAASLTFSTSGKFLSGGTLSADQKTIYYPNNTGSDYIEITFTGVTNVNHTFANNPSLGSFTITTHGSGAVIPSAASLDFRIDFRITAPQQDVRSIWGKIRQADSASPKLISFQSQTYNLLGSTVELCSESTGGPNCADVSFNLSVAPTTKQLYAYITPVKPFRLKILSTGYGPNRARKQLEAVIQRNLLNGIGPGGATTMIGTNETPPGGLPFLYVPGNSNGVTYSGGDCSSSAGCVPSFVVTNPQNLSYIQNNPPRNGTIDPPPALMDASNVPEWQSSPAALDVLVDRYRVQAQNSSRYFLSPGGNVMNPGNFTDGTGITFCEGSCKVAGDGGGTLIVTGKLTNLGGFRFKGMIIVTGEEGWERTGGGGGQVIGNVVIAPYNKRTYVPENLSTTFLAPRYYISGGGSSDIIYGDITASFDNTSSISDLMMGIAEK